MVRRQCFHESTRLCSKGVSHLWFKSVAFWSFYSRLHWHCTRMNWVQFSNFHSFIAHLYAMIIRIIVLKEHPEKNLTETNNWYRAKHYLWTQIIGKHRRLIVILIEMKLSFLQLSFVIMWENHILYIIPVTFFI